MKRERIESKKKVWVKGNSGRYYWIYLHRFPNNNFGWYMTQAQHDKLSNWEPFGWCLDEQDLHDIGAKWVDVIYKTGTYMPLWQENQYE